MFFLSIMSDHFSQLRAFEERNRGPEEEFRFRHLPVVFCYSQWLNRCRSAMEREAELQCEHRQLQAEVEASDIEEAQLVKSCKELREAASRCVSESQGGAL